MRWRRPKSREHDLDRKLRAHLDVIPEYPGTNSVDSPGPTPGVVPTHG